MTPREKETERVRKAGLGARYNRLEAPSKGRCVHGCWIFLAERDSCGRRSCKLSAFCWGWPAIHLTKIYWEKQLHGLAAFRTERSRLLGHDTTLEIRGESRQTQVQRFSRMKLHAQSGSFCGGMTKAVIAHGAQSPGQYVSQIAAHELYARQSEQLAAVLMGAIFPAERDGLAGDGE